jgi:hypothetical protein
MRTYLERTLDAPVSPVVAWDHLARVTDWPSWAPHIRRIEIDPPGALGSGGISSGMGPSPEVVIGRSHTVMPAAASDRQHWPAA